MDDDTGPAVGAVPVLPYPTVSLLLWFLSFTAGAFGGNDSTPQKPLRISRVLADWIVLVVLCL